METIRFRINSDEMKLLQEYAPNTSAKFEAVNGEADVYTITPQDYDKVEDDIDSAITQNLVNQDYLSPTGMKLQALYDNLYSQ